MTDPRYVVVESDDGEYWSISWVADGIKKPISPLLTFLEKAAAKDFCWILNSVRTEGK